MGTDQISYGYHEMIAYKVSIQSSMEDLLDSRSVPSYMQVEDITDLKIFDFLKVICLIWILTFGSAQFTMSGTAYNPWSLENYFQTVAYTLVYSANLGFDEFFMIGAFLSYI